MDREHIKGTAEKAKGSIKDIAGKGWKGNRRQEIAVRR
jgi:uncharacterized protein YjbJ (UPF0337 family)